MDKLCRSTNVACLRHLRLVPVCGDGHTTFCFAAKCFCILSGYLVPNDSLHSRYLPRGRASQKWTGGAVTGISALLLPVGSGSRACRRNPQFNGILLTVVFP